MRAVVIDSFGGPPRVAVIPAPQCPPHGAVIRVEATGVCRSDWHAWQGHDDGVSLPHVPGHEFAGVIDQVGDDVRDWHPGQRVTVPFVCACGQCAACEVGEPQVCERQTQPGFTHDGSFAELVAIDHADLNLIELPAQMSAVTAASLGCRFATAYRALHVHGRVEPGQWVAVFGCGGVGLSAVQIAVAAGARVVAVDVSAQARDAARELGAAVVVDPGDLSREAEPTAVVGERGDPTAEAAPTAVVEPSGSTREPDPTHITKADSPEALAAAVVAASQGGAHVGIDALGDPATAAASILALRRRGRHVQVGLLLADHARPALPMDRVIAWELEIYGSHGMGAREYPAMLERIASGELAPERLVGRTVSLDEAPAALEALGHPGAGGAGMTVVVP